MRKAGSMRPLPFASALRILARRKWKECGAARRLRLVGKEEANTREEHSRNGVSLGYWVKKDGGKGVERLEHVHSCIDKRQLWKQLPQREEIYWQRFLTRFETGESSGQMQGAHQKLLRILKFERCLICLQRDSHVCD